MKFFSSDSIADSINSIQIFAHAKTAVLSYYMQNFAVITALEESETKFPSNLNHKEKSLTKQPPER